MNGVSMDGVDMDGVGRKGLIIIPFRDNTTKAVGDRLEQLNTLLNYLDEHCTLDYYISVQPPGNLFNRGRLLNEAVCDPGNNKYSYFIFHDADLIPDSDLLEYYYEYPMSPIHLGFRGQRYSKNRKFLGGVLSMSRKDFMHVNGFPNDFWGWGGEDDALAARLSRSQISVEVPPKGSVTDLESLTIEQKMDQLRGLKNNTKREQLELDKINSMSNGVKQTKTFHTQKITCFLF